jgi:hypothetical protein
MAFRYYKVFKFMQPDKPRGLLVFNREGNRLDTIAWNHFTKRWEHDPDAVMSYVMGDDRGKHAEINREEAEEIARTVLLTTLPSEPELMSISDEAERRRAQRFGT